jgi:uncharacterized protein (TIGR03032 family)
MTDLDPVAQAAAQPAAKPEPLLAIVPSRQFTAWMAERRASVLFTTYQTAKLFLLGLKPDGTLAVSERTFNRCMGLAANGQTLWLSSLYQLWRFENALPAGQLHDGHDRLYVPQVGYTTGDLDVHDVAIDAKGRPIFVNTLFSCLATVTETASFVPLWQPSFVTKLAAEDRCHLNGLAMADGVPRYVTAVAASDAADAWRDKRRDGGIVIDVATNEIVARGFSMPHSPRLHDGKLWLLDSGTGTFGWVDPASGKFERVCFCPGYARGLAFTGSFALIGLSKPRDNKTFTGLALDDELAKRNVEARCGLLVVDLRTGDTVHWIRIEGVVEELYDVALVPGIRRPTALGFKADEIRRTITVGDA